MTATFFWYETMKFAFYKSAFGLMKIGYEGDSICFLKLEEKEDGENLQNCLTYKAFAQMEEYFRKERKAFDLPFKLKGTSFQIKVWQELLKIPYGETVSYGEIAERLGNPKGARAVGMAVHNNPLWIIVPCHRVIGKNGKLTGYAGGLLMKRKLLQIEGEGADE